VAANVGEVEMSYNHVNSRGITFFLHRTEVTLRGGKRQSIYFFAKVPNNVKGAPADLPPASVVKENPRNGFLTVSPKSGGRLTQPDILMPEVIYSSDDQIPPPELLRSEICTIDAEFLKELAHRPDLVYQLAPRKFEELIAELLFRHGYDVELTPFSKDGGVDIWAAKRESVGCFLYAVQCKHHTPGNRVGVGMVRELYGVVERERATAGILATTTGFTRGAVELQQALWTRLSLRDYYGVLDWLHEAGFTPG
jgi:hypothetical protein